MGGTDHVARQLADVIGASCCLQLAGLAQLGGHRQDVHRLVQLKQLVDGTEYHLMLRLIEILLV